VSEAIACPECSTSDWMVVTLEKNSRTELLDLHDGEWVRHDKDEEVIETSVERFECENGHGVGDPTLFHALNEAWCNADYRG
jgi:hypothetical protein